MSWYFTILFLLKESPIEWLGMTYIDQNTQMAIFHYNLFFVIPLWRAINNCFKLSEALSEAFSRSVNHIPLSP